MTHLSDEQHFTLHDAAPVIGLDAKALSNIIARKQCYISADPAGRGRTRFLSERDVCRLTIAAELMKLGVAPQMAGDAVIRFTDGTGGYPANRACPGALYPSGPTFLALNGQGRVAVVGSLDDAPQALHGAVGFIALDVGEVVSRTLPGVARLPRRHGSGAALHRKKDQADAAAS